MCGIFGHVGNTTKKINIDKLNLLGIQNEVRGIHSCGLTSDGLIKKGIGESAKYRDFLTYYRLNNPSHSPTVIGHTRHATRGEHTKANAHPFGFGSLTPKWSKDPVFEFVGVHNGTLHNHKELAEKRGISLTKDIEVYVKDGFDKQNKQKYKIETKTVDKIDSELLLECIYEDKNYSVLEEYYGAAALVWTDLNEPNVCYFYHGESKKDNYDTKLTEERPLFYYKESKGSLYFSSLEWSLYTIGGDDDTVEAFETNTIYKVTNGNVEKAEKTKIDRSKVTISKKIESFTRSSSNVGFTRPNTRRNSNVSSRIPGINSKTFKPSIGTPEQIQLNLEVPIDEGLIKEEFDTPQQLTRGLTQMKQLRHYRNGHLAKGVMTYIPNYGFFMLGATKESAIKGLEFYADCYFDKGYFITSKHHTVSKSAIIPIRREILKNDPNVYLHYFFDGIRYKNEIDWLNIQNDAVNYGKNKFGTIELSVCSADPIIDLNTDSKRVKGVYFRGSLFTGKINPLGSNKIYNIRLGELKDINFVPNKAPEVLTNGYKEVYSLEKAEAFLNSLEEKAPAKVIELPASKKDKKITVVTSSNEILSDLFPHEETELDKTVLEAFNRNFEKFPEFNRIFNKYRLRSKRAQAAYEAGVNFMQSIQKIIDVEMEIERQKK